MRADLDKSIESVSKDGLKLKLQFQTRMWENVEINKPLRGERTELPEQTQKIMLEQGAPQVEVLSSTLFSGKHK